MLAGLFKISKDEKDKPLVGFLARNFQVWCNQLIYLLKSRENNYKQGTFQLASVEDVNYHLFLFPLSVLLCGNLDKQ